MQSGFILKNEVALSKLPTSLVWNERDLQQFLVSFFSLVILCISTYFLGYLSIHCLSVYWKIWMVLGPVKQSICSPLLTRRKQQLSRIQGVLLAIAWHGKGDLKSSGTKRIWKWNTQSYFFAYLGKKAEIQNLNPLRNEISMANSIK